MVLAVLVALVAAACSDDEPAPAPAAPAPAAPAPAAPADLAAAVPEPPAGFQPIDERSREFDLEQYATGLSVAPDGDRAALSGAGFRRGLFRAWTSTAGGLVVALYLFELGDADGAAEVQEHFLVDGKELLGTAPFEVTGVPGAQGASYGGGTAVTPTRVHAVYLTDGPLFYNLLASHADLSAGPEAAIAFARQVAAHEPPGG